MKRTNAIVVMLAVLTPLVSGPSTAQNSENYIVLRVNNRIATLVDYQLRRDDRLRALAASDTPPEQREVILERLGESVMGDLVEELLLLSRADQLGITAPSGAVDDQIAAARQRSGAETDAEFELALARAGMTREDLRQQIENNVTIRQVINREILGQLEITEEDLRRYYFEHAEEFTRPERRRVREFVLAEDGGSLEELRAAGNRVRAAITAGTDPVEAVDAEPLAGGWFDLGLVTREDLDPDLSQAAWSLEVGQLSEPMEARGGLHVVQVTEIQPAELQDFVEVREQIGAREQQRLFTENYQEYMEDLRRDSYVRLNELPEDAQDFDLATSAQRITLTDLGAGDYGADEPEASDQPAEDETVAGESESPQAPLGESPAENGTDAP